MAIAAAIVVEKKDTSQVVPPIQSTASRTASINAPTSAADVQFADSDGTNARAIALPANPDAPTAQTNPPVDLRVPMSQAAPVRVLERGLAIPGVLCIMVFVMGIVIVVALIVKAISGQQQSGPYLGKRNFPTGHPQPQIGDDGFWLDTSNIPAGSKVRYRYYANGQEFNDTVLSQGGPRQYVYTGGLPTNIMILETILMAQNALHPPGMTSVMPPTMHTHVSPPTPPATPSKFGGFPAAY